MMCSASAFLQLFRSVRLPAPACGCLYLSVCASVNVCGLTASKLKLQETGRGGGKKAYRYLTQQSGKYAQIRDRRGASLGMHL